MYFFPYAFENSSSEIFKCLNGKLSEFKNSVSSESNVAIVGVSTDSSYAHLAWIKSFDTELNIPIASDLSTSVSKAFGVLDEGHSKNCAFIISPTKSILYFVEFPFKINGNVICDQLLIHSNHYNEKINFIHFDPF